MKCWNSTVNAQGSRVILVVVWDIGAVKIYVAAGEALRKKERQHETQFTTKIGGKVPLYNHVFGDHFFVILMNCDLNKYSQDCDYRGGGGKTPYKTTLLC